VNPQPDIGPKAKPKTQTTSRKQGLTLSAPFACLGAVEGFASRQIFTTPPNEYFLEASNWNFRSRWTLKKEDNFLKSALL